MPPLPPSETLMNLAAYRYPVDPYGVGYAAASPQSKVSTNSGTPVVKDGLKVPSSPSASRATPTVTGSGGAAGGTGAGGAAGGTGAGPSDTAAGSSASGSTTGNNPGGSTSNSSNSILAFTGTPLFIGILVAVILLLLLLILFCCIRRRRKVVDNEKELPRSAVVVMSEFF